MLNSVTFLLSSAYRLRCKSLLGFVLDSLVAVVLNPLC